MTENECLEKMVSPGTHRPGKYGSNRGFGGVIQIIVTSACDKSCFHCTQASNFRREPWFMSPEQFEQAVRSLGFTGELLDFKFGGKAGNEQSATIGVPADAYFGVVGLFGGNPAISPHFDAYCEILRRLVPFEQRGVWCNNPITIDRAREMARTFDPSVSNLNVHLDRNAYSMFKQGWPACSPVGLTEDSRHSPVFVAMKDVVKKQCDRCLGAGTVSFTGKPCGLCDGTGRVPDESSIHGLISNCDINQHWSAAIGVFRGELRAWFCEVAAAQAMLHQHEPNYPDTGLRPELLCSLVTDPTEHAGKAYQHPNGPPVPSTSVLQPWWKLPITAFRDQVRKHCFDCGVPLRGYGELSQSNDVSAAEQVSAAHVAVSQPKRKDRAVHVVDDLVQLEVGKIQKVNHYLQNARV